MERFTVNGKEVEFDPFDLDAMEVYMDGVALVEERRKTDPADKGPVEERRKTDPADKGPVDTLRRVCNAILDFFDDLLGEGKARELFGQRVNVKDIFEGYRSFTTQVNDCISAYSKDLNGGAQPAAVVPLNRAQRRRR